MAPLRFSIRPYVSSEAVALTELFRNSVRAIGPRDYSAQQVAAWADRVSAERLDARLLDGRLTLVAEGEDGRRLAFGDLEADGHIDFLYASPDAAGKGVVTALYGALETQARAQGMTRLYTEASEAARRFFLKHGFAVVQRRDFSIGETPMHNYAMEKQL
jgi:putative acetyltransferase